MDEELFVDIMREMQKKKDCVYEILDITKEMGNALSRDDRMSAQMLLGMRQEEMDKADRCDANIGMWMETMPPTQRIALSDWLKGNPSDASDSLVGNRIMELAISIRGTLEKAIAADKAISSRLAGNESYYH